MASNSGHQSFRVTVRATATRTISCAETAAQLWTLLDGELDAARAWTVQAHLRECASCRAKYASARAFVTRVAQSGASDVAPEALRERVRQMLRERGLVS